MSSLLHVIIVISLNQIIVIVTAKEMKRRATWLSG